ncbi:uncharacterized protein FYW61_000448 [Anableps anableps]
MPGNQVRESAGRILRHPGGALQGSCCLEAPVPHGILAGISEEIRDQDQSGALRETPRGPHRDPTEPWGPLRNLRALKEDQTRSGGDITVVPSRIKNRAVYAGPLRTPVRRTKEKISTSSSTPDLQPSLGSFQGLKNRTDPNRTSMFPAANSSSVTVVSAVLMVTVMMMMVATAEAAPKHHRKPSGGSAEETVSLHLDPSVLLPSRNFRPLQNASISPWTYQMSHNESLFPPIMSEARCLLQGCLDLEGKEDHNLMSKPIMYQVMVLRRVKKEGAGPDYHYHLESRLIPVGCTCVRHTVHVQE